MINSDKRSEGIHYELIPSDEHEQAWNIRILKGIYVETVIQYGAIGFNEILDNMSFNFFVISSPDEELTNKDIDLQNEAAAILEQIIANGLKDGSIGKKEQNAED